MGHLLRRWYVWLVVLLAALLAMLLLCLSLQDGNRISEANFVRIEKGMPRSEVDALLGEPAKVIEMGQNHDPPLPPEECCLLAVYRDHHATSRGSQLHIEIVFRPDGTVMQRIFVGPWEAGNDPWLLFWQTRNWLKRTWRQARP